MKQTMADYTTVRATTETADMLRDFVYLLTGGARRRVSQSDALRAALIIANRHMDEAVQIVTQESES